MMKKLAFRAIIGVTVNGVWFLVVTLNDDFILSKDQYKIFYWGWSLTIRYPLYLGEYYETWVSALLKATINLFTCAVIVFVAFALFKRLRNPIRINK
jgi:hypothetical protein